MMDTIKKNSSKATTGSQISVSERISLYKSAVKDIKSSPEETRKYLKSTGIYTRTGRLTKNYK